MSYGPSGRRIMPKTTITGFILKLHRWLALLLAPVFLLILLSGAVLAFKPVTQSTPAKPVNVLALITALDKVDPQGKAASLTLARDGYSFELHSRGPGPNGRFDLQSARSLNTGSPDLFDIALRLHKSLLIGAGFLVDIATYVMVFLIASGLVAGWRKLRNTLSGWHSGIAWLAFPLVVLTPATALLMVLHLGMPRLPAYQAAAHPLPIARALEAASQHTDLSTLSQARSFRRGATMLSMAAENAMVSGNGEFIRISQGPGWVRTVHEGLWANGWGAMLNLLSALSLLGLLFTGVWSWARRRRQSRLRSPSGTNTQHAILVAFASQTGTAAKFAEATATALRNAGRQVVLASLAALTPKQMNDFAYTLLIASTTGKGELPDPARSFMQQLGATSMQGCRFSLLALGDRHYPTFCAGGMKLRSALIEQGAEEIFPLETVDDGAARTWQQWLKKIGQQSGLGSLDSCEPEQDQELRLQLIERNRLDNSEESGLRTTWQLRFRLSGPKATFRPGDLLQISPGQNAATRSYSIGSSSIGGDQLIDLTVGLHCHTATDGEQIDGQCSGYLCKQLTIGSEIGARLHRHDGFNPPSDLSRPLILIASGSGIAPFPGFLSERRNRTEAGPVWLFFGNRKQRGDFYHQAFFDSCMADGTLHRLDTAFSRDADDGAYIQQRIEEQGNALMQWMDQQNAIIYVCGNADTLGIGVEQVLTRLIMHYHDASKEEANTTLDRWKAEGRLKLDLFS